MIISAWLLWQNKTKTKIVWQWESLLLCYWSAFVFKRQTSLRYSNEMQPRCINAACTCIFTTAVANICVIYACVGTKWAWPLQLRSPQSASTFIDSPLHPHHHPWPPLSLPSLRMAASRTVRKKITEKILSELAELLRGSAFVVGVKNRWVDGWMED